MRQPKRGEALVWAFAEEIIEKINQPKCLEKPDWCKQTWGELLFLMIEEVKEISREIDSAEKGDIRGLVGIYQESADVAAMAAMMRDKALRALWESSR